MSIPVISGAALTAAALLDAAALVEEAGISGLSVACCQDRVTIFAGSSLGDATSRAAVVTALGELAGAARCRQLDSASGTRAAWLQATGKAGGSIVEISTPLTVRVVPGGALAARPDGQQAVIGAGEELPGGWRWVTDLDDDDPGQRAEAVA